MLNPNNNRLDYGDILSPPNNYQLDFAIGTTYSLDLDALVGAAISLGLSEETDTNLINNPIFLLEALRTTADKVILFCEGGQIHLPNQPNPLYILLEEMVFQVSNSKLIQSKYASFHPKFWLLRYVDEENNVLYRVVVLSRNLTFDRSWDISFSMDGFKSEERTDKNNPIIDFLAYLKEFSKNDEKSSKISAVIDELQFVRFELNSNDFYDFDFIPNGIGDYSISDYPLFNESFDELLIMSPFLSKIIIRAFNENINNDKAMLFTRENSLNGFTEKDCGNFEIFSLKDQIIDGEKGGPNSPFQLVNIEKFADEKEAPENNDLSLIVKAISRSNPKACIAFNENSYNIGLCFNKLKEDFIAKFKDYKIEIRPLLSKKKSKFERKICFKNIDKIRLSEFFVVSVYEKTEEGESSIERVIKVPVSGLPEDREKEVISSVVNDKEAFIRYVAFLLGDDYIISVMESEMMDGLGSANLSFRMQLPELYEKMLKASLYAPEKFDELEFLIKTLSDDDVIPDGFEDLYNTFKQVVD